MKKHIIYLVAIGIVAVWTGIATTASAIQGKQIKEQHQTIVQQQTTIDSLLNRRMNVFDVRLSVEDKSRLTVYGKKTENLSIPATKTYMLKLDSVSVKQLEK